MYKVVRNCVETSADIDKFLSANDVTLLCTLRKFLSQRAISNSLLLIKRRHIMRQRNSGTLIQLLKPGE